MGHKNCKRFLPIWAQLPSQQLTKSLSPQRSLPLWPPCVGCHKNFICSEIFSFGVSGKAFVKPMGESKLLRFLAMAHSSIATEKQPICQTMKTEIAKLLCLFPTPGWFHLIRSKTTKSTTTLFLTPLTSQPTHISDVSITTGFTMKIRHCSHICGCIHS